MANALSTYELVKYYVDLLIVQYKQKMNARGTVAALVSGVLQCQTTVQEVTFSDIPASGSFDLSYLGLSSVTIQWNDSDAAIQIALRSISGLDQVVVTGSIASQTLQVTFDGVIPSPVAPLVVENNTVQNGSSEDVSITVTETDLILPLAVQNGYNLIGDNIAEGAQLDVLGKYVGVSRNYPGVVLDDDEMLTSIRFAISKNSSQSSLETIINLLESLFPGDFIIIDYMTMRISYIFNSSVVNPDLVTVLIAGGLIPKPAAVGATVILTPVIDQFFGMSSYSALNLEAQDFNTYGTWTGSKVFLSYSNVINV